MLLLSATSYTHKVSGLSTRGDTLSLSRKSPVSSPVLWVVPVDWGRETKIVVVVLIIVINDSNDR